MSEYKLHLIGKKSIKIIERFDNSVLVKYVKTGIEASVDPKLIKTITIKNKKLCKI